MTNGDRLRSMTDEELATRLQCDSCLYQVMKSECESSDCASGILAWLRREASEYAPVVRPIDANALIGFLHNQDFIDGDDRSRVYKWIEEQPTIKSERPHGRWIECCNELDKKCSCCDKVHGTIYETEPFCPNCGAEMDAKIYYE